MFVEMTASTRNLAALPDLSTFRQKLQSLAMLDAILEGEWDYRCYSFNSRWSQTEQMGSMRNGSGDDFFAVFDAAGCFLRGFDHESPMSPWGNENAGVWPGVLDAVPAEFADSLNEPAFHMDDTTFCIWRRATDDRWFIGPIEFPEHDDPDGSSWMLTVPSGTAANYRAFAEEYFELDVPLAAIERVFAHEALSADLIAAFPSARTLDDLSADAEEIGYPVAGTRDSNCG